MLAQQMTKLNSRQTTQFCLKRHGNFIFFTFLFLVKSHKIFFQQVTYEFMYFSQFF